MGGTASPDGGLPAGQLNAAIANEIWKLTADFTGRGSEKSRAFVGGHLLAAISNPHRPDPARALRARPIKAKTYALDDLIVVVMPGSGFTPLEKDDHGLRRARARRRDAP